MTTADALPRDLVEQALPDPETPQSAGRLARDRAATVTVWAAFVIAMIPLVWIIVALLVKGGGVVLSASWWTNSQRGMTTLTAGGGAYHAIIGTLLQAVVTAVISVPLAIMTAIYLIEYGRSTRFGRLVSFMLDILTGVPSIVAGLFIYALWVTTFGLQRVPFAVCLALVLLMVPVVTRSTEEMLKLVPNELREASYALGVSKWKTIVKIVLPTALSGITTGILLGLARVMGETAPLLILGPYSQSIATNLFSGFMGTLPTMINTERNEVADIPLDRVWGAALTLIVIVLLLNLAGRLVARYSAVRK